MNQMMPSHQLAYEVPYIAGRTERTVLFHKNKNVQTNE